MPELTYNTPVVGAPHSTEDPKTRNALIAIKDLLNGELDYENLDASAVTAAKVSDSLASALGVNNGSVDGRGYATVATSQSTSSTSFTDLSTVGPSVTVDTPSNGWVRIFVQALITPAAGADAVVGVYEATDLSTPVAVLTATAGASVATMVTVPGSVTGANQASASGGFIEIPVSGGTQTYILKYKRGSGSGSVTFASRKLWVVAGGPMP